MLSCSLLLSLLFVTESMHAQRRAVRTSKRTVVRVSSPRVVYARPYPTVRAVRTLPSSAVVVRRGGVTYRHHAGLYYRPVNGRYVVVSAPIGVRVTALPVGYRRIVVAGVPYFYFQGNYYVTVNGGYEVVQPPLDSVVYELPEDAEALTIEGSNYYAYGGTLYKVVTTPEGKAFKVVGDLEWD